MSSTRIPIIRTSERRSFKRCEQQWYWAWRCGLKTVGTPSDALWFGTLMHTALAVWYCGPGTKRGAHPAETFERLAGDEIRYIKVEARQREDNVTTFVEEKLEPAREMGIDLLTAYVDHYGLDDSWHVIQPEHSGQLDVFTEDGKRQLAIYAFTYDLVYRDLLDERIYLGEHKSAKAIRTDHLPLDDQAGSYWAVAPIELLDAGLIKKTDRLAGITYNFLRKSVADDRPTNAQGLYCNKPTRDDYVNAMVRAGINFVEGSGRKSGPVAVEKATLKDLQTAAAFGQVTVLGEVSKVQPAPRFLRETVMRNPAERKTQVERIRAEAVTMDAVRRGELPLIKHTGDHCSWCPYHDMCLLHERGDGPAVDDLREALYVQQDPYADHRKSVSE